MVTPPGSIEPDVTSKWQTARVVPRRLPKKRAPPWFAAQLDRLERDMSSEAVLRVVMFA